MYTSVGRKKGTNNNLRPHKFESTNLGDNYYKRAIEGEN